MQKLTVIKVGGKIVEEPETLSRLIDDFAQIDGPKILIHGGGRSATAMASRLGIETTMIDGRRVTDGEMLNVVTMVYGGLVNKQIVAALQGRGVNAIGLTGADLNIIRSHRRPATPVDYGYVGDVDKVDAKALLSLINSGAVPVIAPLSHDGNGQMLNTNADTIASQVAQALAPLVDTTLTFCFEKPGVLAEADNDDSVIANIDRDYYAELRQQGVVAGGMIPKLDNAFAAIDAGVKEVIITRADALSDLALGTHIH